MFRLVPLKREYVGWKNGSSSKTEILIKKLAVIEDKVTNKCDNMLSNTVCASGNEGLIKSLVQGELHKKSEEEKDVENRKRNIIIYRAPKKQCDIAADRKEADATFVKDLLDGVFNMELHDGDIEKMYRLGHWTNDKARPLLVAFRDYEQKETIMANLRKCKDNPITKFQGISIAHDLPPKERQEIKNLIEAAKKEHSEQDSETTENYWFWVVGQRDRRRVIKIKKQNYSA